MVKGVEKRIKVTDVDIRLSYKMALLVRLRLMFHIRLMENCSIDILKINKKEFDDVKRF